MFKGKCEFNAASKIERAEMARYGIAAAEERIEN